MRDNTVLALQSLQGDEARWGRLTNAPAPDKDVHILIPGTGENVPLPGKGGFADVIRLKILSWRDYPGVPVGPTVITRVLIGGRQEGQAEKAMG